MWQVGFHLGMVLIALPAYVVGFFSDRVTGVTTILCGAAVVANAILAMHYLGFYL